MTDSQKNNAYTGAIVYDGLKGVRHQIGMYLGSTGVVNERHAPRALTQMAQEVVSNSRDEILAGWGDWIRVVIHKDNSMTVSDHGRGIPKGPGDSFKQVVNMLTKTHASGKFGSENYAAAGVAGMHGIGLKAVNAASRYVTINAVSHQTRDAGSGDDELTGKLEKYSITFHQDEVVESSYDVLDESVQTGTSITFLPDDGPVSDDKPRSLFESIEWTLNDLEPMLEATACLMPGTRVELIDERPDDEFEREWLYKEGLADYVRALTESQKPIKGLTDPIVFDEVVEHDGYEFQVKGALTFTDDTSTSVLSFANGVPTREGGPHHDGFVSGVVSGVNEACRVIRGSSKVKFVESDVFSGVTAAFEVRVPGEIASFEGQTKEKLGTVQARRVTRDVMETCVINALTDNRDIAERVFTNAEAAASARNELAKQKRDAQAAKKTKKQKNKLVTSEKLRAATSRRPEERELYIVEGDSASEIGRDPKTQAVFPIRGKIPNVMSCSLRDVLANTELSTMIETIGAGMGPSFNVDDVQYGKIIIASDADSDGSHIRMLLFTFFYLYMPDLIKSGKLYALKPPLYRAEKYVNGERKLVVAYTDREMREQMSDLKGYDISRYKGLGMMDREEAHRYIADPEHRQIEQLHIDDEASVKRYVTMLMGDNAGPRRSWIESHVKF